MGTRGGVNYSCYFRMKAQQQLLPPTTSSKCIRSRALAQDSLTACALSRGTTSRWIETLGPHTQEPHSRFVDCLT
eukprot:2919204-Pyramimonas_sp.AAC.1